MTDNNEHHFFASFEKTDDDYLDESAALIKQWCEYYSEKFLASDVAQNKLSEEQLEEFPFILDSFSVFCYGYHLQKPGQWTSTTVADVCENIMPRKVMAEEAYFEAIAPVLAHFLSWMSSEKYLTNTDALTKAISSVEMNICHNAKDPSRWGMAKSMVMGAQAKGYDVGNHHTIETALATEDIDDLLTSAQESSQDSNPPAKTADEINTLEDIENELRYLTVGFPEAAVKAALERQQEITPILMGFLNEVIENYETLSSNYFGHLYAMFLLAQFREKEAFPLVIKIASLPDKWPDNLLDDTITEDFHKIIASVYNNDLTAIQRLVEDPNTYTWSRDAALRSLLVLVKSGNLDRQWVIEYFKTLFAHSAFCSDDMAITYLVNAACDLYPAELYDEIKLAFEQDKVDTSWLGMEEIDSVLTLGEEAALQQNLTDYSYGLVDDVIKSMSTWFCFDPSEKGESDDDFEDFEIPPQFENPTSTLPYRREIPKVGRNAPCPCGSGKKYKKCCLQAEVY